MLRRIRLSHVTWVCLIVILLMGCTSVGEQQTDAETATLDPAATLEESDIAEESEMAEESEAAEESEMAEEPEIMGTVVETTFAQWVIDDTPAEGAESTLTRMPHGIYVNLKAEGLEPYEVYTMWWVIMNKPENCTDGVCGLDDGFLLDDQGNIVLIDDEPQFNWPGRAAVDFSLHRATGSIVDEDGSIEFRAHLSVGDVTEAYFGGEGLDDPYRSEVHAVIRTHGDAVPGKIHAQMMSPWGGCPEGWPKAPCRNVIFTVHRAPIVE